MVVRDTNISNPVQGVATRSCDTKLEAVFPSVNGGVVVYLLLKVMANNDAAAEIQYSPPAGMELAANIINHDKTTAAYHQKMTHDGLTGDCATSGSGNCGRCKDAWISFLFQLS